MITEACGRPSVLSGPFWTVRGPGPWIRVAIALADDAFGRLGDVISACRVSGFKEELTLAGVGVITGVVGAANLAALRAVPGVTAVVVAGSAAGVRPLRARC